MPAMFRLIPHRAFVEPHAEIAEIDSEGTTATLRIDGLLCSACAATVRGRLERIDGVRRAAVDLDRGRALVTFDPSSATPDSLVEAVESAVILRPLRRLLAALGGKRAMRQADH